MRVLDRAIASGRGAEEYIAWIDARREQHDIMLALEGGSPTGAGALLLLEDLHSLREIQGLVESSRMGSREEQHAAFIRARWSRSEREKRLLENTLNPPGAETPLEDIGTLGVRARFLTAVNAGRHKEALEALGFLRARKAEHDPGEVEYFESLYRLRAEEWEEALVSAARVPLDSPDHPKARFVQLSAAAHIGDVGSVTGLIKGRWMTPALANMVGALVAMNGEYSEDQMGELVAEGRDSALTVVSVRGRFDPYAEEAARVLLPLSADFIRQIRDAMVWAEIQDVRELPDRLDEALDALAPRHDSRRESLERVLDALQCATLDLTHSGLSLSRDGGASEPMHGYISLAELIWFDFAAGGTGIGPAGACLFAPIEIGPAADLLLEWYALREEFGDEGRLVETFRENPAWFTAHPTYVPLLVRSLRDAERDDPVFLASVMEMLPSPIDVTGVDTSIPEVVPHPASLVLSSARQALHHLRSTDQVWADAGPVAVGLFGALESTIWKALIEPALRSAALEPLDPEGWSKRELEWARTFSHLMKVATGTGKALALGPTRIFLGKVARPGKGRDAPSRRYVREMLRGALTSAGSEALETGALDRLIDTDLVDRIRNKAGHGSLVSIQDAAEAERYVLGCLAQLNDWVAKPVGPHG